MNDNDKYVIRAGSTASGHYETAISAKDAGWEFSSLRVLGLSGGDEVELDSGAEELLVLPLAGSVSVTVGEDSYEIKGRESVFSALTDYLFIPRNTAFTLRAAGPARIALPAAKASKDLAVRYCPVSEVNTGIRGSGVCSRQVNNYALGNDLETSHLLVTEVITPGGNWSSYPPHKHDEHTEEERELEEIYYYEIAPGGPKNTAGFGLQRIYSSGKEIDVCAEVRDRDTVLVPHGYHGPSVAAPGHDMYYLNVMAGPAEDAVWLMTDDPAHTWQRQAWEGEDTDPRLPMYGKEA